MPTPPINSPEERAAALADALAARQARAKIKQDVKSGATTVGAVLDQGHRGSGDKTAGRMQVGELVEAVDGLGDVKTAKVLAEAGITDGTEHLDELTAEQVAAVKTALGE